MPEPRESQLLEGDLASVALPQVLKALAVRQATGILTVQGEEDIVAVSCLTGHIVTADSLNQTHEESLGELLIHQKLVPKGDFDAVVMEHQGSGGSLGDLLVSRGLITREKLLECLRLQTYRLMLQILTWRRGEFKFYGGDEVSYEKGVTPISVDEMLIRALAELGEKSGVGGEVPRLDAIYRKVPPRGGVHVLGRDGLGDSPGIWVTEAQQAFLERMDGRSSAYDIARSLGAGRFKTLFSLHQLIQQDLIELVQVARPQTLPDAPPRPVARPPTASFGPAAGPAPVSVSGPAPVASTNFAPATPTPAPGTGRSYPTAPLSLAGREEPRPAPAVPEPPARREATAQVRTRVPADERAVAAAPSTPRPWIGPAFAGLLAVSVLLGLLISPGTFLLPFPWQTAQRAAVERQMRQTLYHKIDRAVLTLYLMEFKYPDTLVQLVDRELLSPADLSTGTGQRLRFSSSDEAYRIELLEDEETVESRAGSVGGNFVADQEYFPPEDVRNPLVLLD
jgi:hypothetical protein